MSGVVIPLVWRTDIHFADSPPQSRTDDWTQTIIGKINQVGRIAADVQAVAVLDGGDFFHVKSPSRNSHELVRQAAAAHESYLCPVFGNVGNHDLKYGSMEYLSESPLGVLFETGAFGRVYDDYEVYFGPVEGGALRVGIYPFHRKTGWKLGDPFEVENPHDIPIVRVVGIPYHGAKYDMNRFTGFTKGRERWFVVIAHCLASPRGGTLFESEDVISYDFLANLDADVHCLGHWHKNQGVTEVARGKWVVNIGSLSRGALTEDELTRIPACAVMRFTSNDVQIEQVPLDVAPASTVFDIVGRIRQEARKMTVDALVESIQGVLTHRPEVSLIMTVQEMPGIQDRVRERAIHYLERVGAR